MAELLPSPYRRLNSDALLRRFPVCQLHRLAYSVVVAPVAFHPRLPLPPGAPGAGATLHLAIPSFRSLARFSFPANFPSLLASRRISRRLMVVIGHAKICRSDRPNRWPKPASLLQRQTRAISTTTRWQKALSAATRSEYSAPGPLSEQDRGGIRGVGMRWLVHRRALVGVDRRRATGGVRTALPRSP